MVSTKVPSSHVTWDILPTIAPPHSAWLRFTTFGLTLKVLSHKPKWGWMQRKASHTTINAEIVEDEIGGQIMKIQPVVEHEPTDKWVEGKSQSADEVGKKNYPLMGSGVGIICPASGSRCAISAAKYPASRIFLMFSSMTEETIHLPPAPDILGVV